MARVTAKYDIITSVTEEKEVPFDDTEITNETFDSIEELEIYFFNYYSWDTDVPDYFPNYTGDSDFELVRINEEDLNVLVEKYKYLVKEPKVISCCEEYIGFGYTFCPKCGKKYDDNKN